MDRVIDYYFSPNSPWTYLGHARFAAYLQHYRATVRVKPADLAQVFEVSGGLPLGKRAAQRRSYRLIELARYGKHLNVPIHVEPKFFPVDPTKAALRIVGAVLEQGNEAAMRLTEAIGRAVWQEERDIADDAVLDAIASENGFDADVLRAVAAEDAARATYAANTAEAIEMEVFGAPTYIPRFGPAKDERFWGQDRLDFLERAIAGA